MPLNEGAINEILPFCPDGTEAAGDLLSLAEYAAHTTRLRGHQKGLALREIENRALRQALLMSAGVAQYIANRYATGVLDNGDLDAIEEGLKSALAAQFPAATEEIAGIMRFATAEEGAARESRSVAATPADLAGLTMNKWNARAIGERFAIQTHLVGAETPPNEPDGPRFVKLTAGDAYNTDLLSGETVTGTAPLITATAVIALESSPLYGQTVHLLNTEGRFPRPGVSGVLQDDAFQGHRHAAAVGSSSGTQASFYGSGNSTPYFADGRIREPVSDDVNGTPRTAAETRVRNIAETNYMRIF